METVLADQVQKSVIGDIAESPFFGLVLEETCDINVEKKLVVYIRYLKDGKACTS